MSKDKLLQAINTIVAETKEEERNSNNVTMYTFIQPPVTNNTPREKTDVANERRISSDGLIETLKGINRLTLQSTIYNSTDDHSNKNVAKSNPKSDPLVSTHTSDGNERKISDTDTTKGNFPHKLLMNREIPAIIQGVIPPINQTTADGVAPTGSRLAKNISEATADRASWTKANNHYYFKS